LVVLCRIPLWYEVKLLFVAWLVLPQFRGASFIYDRLVREQLRKHGVRLHDRHRADHGPHHDLKVMFCSSLVKPRQILLFRERRLTPLIYWTRRRRTACTDDGLDTMMLDPAFLPPLRRGYDYIFVYLRDVLIPVLH
jgi:hypothetical protein